jgi:EAL domain-containing protein (putative c-di-GMP-specific phosphodiesterase class I)
VAEGIEHSAELRLLGELDVPLAQGFYTGRPGRPWPDVRTARSSAVESDPAAVAVDAPAMGAAAAGSLLPA